MISKLIDKNLKRKVQLRLCRCYWGSLSQPSRWWYWDYEYYVGLCDRTYAEIGLRLSVGARARDIMTQFLVKR
jgi:hypothetical protein